MRFLFTIAIFTVALTAYATMVRPALKERDEFKTFLERADGFWARLWTWLKARWDICAAFVMIAAPDVVDLLEQIRVMDLSAAIAMMSEQTRGYVQAAIQLSGIAIPILRAWLIRRVA